MEDDRGYPEEFREIASAALCLCSFKIKESRIQRLAQLEETPRANSNGGLIHHVAAVPEPTPAAAANGSTPNSKGKGGKDPKPPRPGLPSLPPVASSLRNIIGPMRTEPFEKQLTPSDLNEDQCRLLIHNDHYDGHVKPLLRSGEHELAKQRDKGVGVRVTLYGPDGKAYMLRLRNWSKYPVLNSSQWKSFLRDHKDLKADEDYLRFWMFRHAISGELSCIVTWSK